MPRIEMHGDHRVLKITRLFEAEPPRVFEKWSRADLLATWFCPANYEILKLDADFKVGGSFRIELSGPEGCYVARGRYLEIEPPTGLAFTHTLWDEGAISMREHVVTIGFSQIGGDTLMQFDMREFHREKAREHHAIGWNQAFDKLAGF